MAAGPAVDRLVEAAGIAGRRRRRARAALLAERLAGKRLTGILLIRLAPGSGFWRQVRWANLHRALLGFAGCYLAGYSLLLASWWALGAGVLGGHFVRDGILAWGLILVSIVPFRAMDTWCRARLTLGAGALLKRRLRPAPSSSSPRRSATREWASSWGESSNPRRSRR